MKIFQRLFGKKLEEKITQDTQLLRKSIRNYVKAERSLRKMGYTLKLLPHYRDEAKKLLETLSSGLTFYDKTKLREEVLKHFKRSQLFLKLPYLLEKRFKTYAPKAIQTIEEEILAS